MFKSTLPAEWPAPPPAPIKPDSAWQASTVRANVRRWISALGLSPPELISAEREWEMVFDSLPSNGDVSLLGSRQLLVWRPPPPAPPLRGLTDPAGHAHNDMVENPVVNPIYGFQRPAGQIHTELDAYQDEARTGAEADGRLAPIFLSDYLFLELQTGSDARIVLGRVVGTPFGGATLLDHVAKQISTFPFLTLMVPCKDIEKVS